MNEVREKLSAFVICHNEEKNIRRCLDSLKWCDEIVVVDSGSCDSTLAICAEYTKIIFHREWKGYVDQKRFALSRCSNDWAINIDADEEISDSLRNEIETLLKTNINSADGYYLPRVVFFLGRWWKRGGWYPEFRLRLVRKSKTEWGGEDPHEKAIVRGNLKRLKGELYHYTYEDIEDQLAKLNRFSSTAAESQLEKFKNPSLFQMVTNPMFRFLKFYFLRKGFLEGPSGLIAAVNEAHYVFSKYAKIWEAKTVKNRFKHRQP